MAVSQQDIEQNIEPLTSRDTVDQTAGRAGLLILSLNVDSHGHHSMLPSPEMVSFKEGKAAILSESSSSKSSSGRLIKTQSLSEDDEMLRVWTAWKEQRKQQRKTFKSFREEAGADVTDDLELIKRIAMDHGS